MSPSKDPADKDYKAPDPAPPDQDAEEQEETRALLRTHGDEGPVKPPPPDDDYPAEEGEADAGYHLGPPKRINCPECGHAHQISYDECQRCGASLVKAKKDAGIS
jgi:hypothetical protein